MMELLSPAGSPEALRSAVENGANAVYLGWGDFNARRNAKNFSDEEFAWAVAYCHERDVRVFLTLNTLLTDRELPRALETARAASRLGVDAVLVQDWGLYALLRATLPDLPLHASTQMSLFTSGGANELAELGCERIVLARECSREDVAQIVRNCKAEVEVFAHGALCMCYSGQCSLSALVGGRSGNRGACAQPCRLPCALDGKPRDQYALSLKDSCLASELEDMRRMGVSCVKLEGRMKRPEYVATVTNIYAKLLEERRPPTDAERSALEAAFSRQGFTDFYWKGKTGPEMFGTHRPEASPPAPTEAPEERRIPVRFVCRIAPDAPASLTASDGGGHTVTVTGPVPESARTRPLTAEDLTARLQKTGGTAYRCEAVDVEVSDGLSLPASAVNALRRDALAALTAARTAVPPRRELPPPPVPEAPPEPKTPEYTVSVSKINQITQNLLDFPSVRLYIPLEELAHETRLPDYQGEYCAILPRVWRDRDEPRLRDWLSHAKSMGVSAILLGNLGHLSLIRGWEDRQGVSLYGDYGLNVFNTRSLAFLKDRGLDSACLSYELRFAQIRDLGKVLPSEAIVYGRLPLMVTENCLVRNKLGCGHYAHGPEVPQDAPCRSSHVLVDRSGAKFPVLPAYGHRTELQNAAPLYLADRQDWKRLGLRYGRLRFTVETPEECAEICQAYLDGAPAKGAFTRGLYDRGVE